MNSNIKPIIEIIKDILLDHEIECRIYKSTLICIPKSKDMRRCYLYASDNSIFSWKHINDKCIRIHFEFCNPNFIDDLVNYIKSYEYIG